MIKIGSLFSGAIDGMAMGFQMASDKYSTIVSNEIENTAVKTAGLNCDHKIIQDDIRSISIEEYRGCDIIVVTFPCQEYSRATHIHKAGRKDNWKQAYHWGNIRDLFLHFFRFIAYFTLSFKTYIYNYYIGKHNKRKAININIAFLSYNRKI